METTAKATCGKCGGNGLYYYGPMSTGVCFACNGTGRARKIAKRPPTPVIEAPLFSGEKLEAIVAELRAIYVTARAGQAIDLVRLSTLMGWVGRSDFARSEQIALAFRATAVGAEALDRLQGVD